MSITPSPPDTRVSCGSLSSGRSRHESGGTAGVKFCEFDWKEFVDMSNLVINDGIPFRRETRMVWTVRKLNAIRNCYFCAAAQTPVHTEFQIDVAVSPHHLQPVFTQATLDLFE